MKTQDDNRKLDIKAVVDKLIGDVKAYGESNHDEESNGNLIALGELYLHIQSKICECAELTSRYEGSMNYCGKIAVKYLKTNLEYVKETIEDCEEKDYYKGNTTL